VYELQLSAEKFKELLKNHNIKQKEIAERIGVDRTYISQMSNGRGVSKLCAYAICKAISPELELEDLFSQK
jgi:transcriptional regulator with XRE-family HTH domain